tara:strand:- start:738 stop:1754 length:1017 start_codon:yes stop_codon:yes gene_type:complete
MCGIFGFAKKSGHQTDSQLEILKRVFTELTDESSIRGMDSTGFSVINPYSRKTIKTLVDSSTLVESKEWNNVLDEIDSTTTIVMGHVRLATHGVVKVNNAHPFNIGNVTLAHNGIIHNYNAVAKSLGKSVPEVDSQVLLQCLNKKDMSRAFEDIDGDFAITWVKEDNNSIHLARESGRPMVVAYWKKARVLLWASTKEIMLEAMTRAGIILPIKSVPQDFIFTYNTERFDSRDNNDKTPFHTLSQWNKVNDYYGYGGSYGNYNRTYYGKKYNAYNPSPASQSLLGDTKKDMCSYCYEYLGVDELYTNEYNKSICIDCEYIDLSFKEKGGQDEKEEAPF